MSTSSRECEGLQSRSKKRVLVCYTELLHYRLPLLQELAGHYDLTVVHSGRDMTGGRLGFREIVLPHISFKRFRYQVGLRPLVRTGRFDAVIFFLDLAWLSIVIDFLLCPVRTRRVTWGLWRTKRTAANRVRVLAARFADANIFYSRGAAQDFRSLGVPASKIMVARNTFHVAHPTRDESTQRDCILFVGTFDVRKQNDVTVRAFARAASRITKPVRLVFVGDGVDKDRIVRLASSEWCSDRIDFYVGTTDSRTLSSYYSRAICSVSYGQAGLSVLQSFAYGVPFVTRKDAISGGEIENIVDRYNGILCDNDENSLEEALVDLCSDTDFAGSLGRNALAYYQKQASPAVMIAGFISAIEGVQGCGDREPRSET